MEVKPLEDWMLDTVRFGVTDREDLYVKDHIRALMNRNDTVFWAGVINEDRPAGLSVKVIGIAGLWKAMYVVGEWGIWLTDEARKHHGYAIHRAALKMIASIPKMMGIRQVIALCDPGKARSQVWLERLGFELKYAGVEHEGKNYALYQIEL